MARSALRLSAVSYRFVIGGTSAESCLKTVKLASTKYYDELPIEGNEHGQAFRDTVLEAKLLEYTRKMGYGPSLVVNTLPLMCASSVCRVTAPLVLLGLVFLALRTATPRHGLTRMESG